jgi:cell division protein FtsA
LNLLGDKIKAPTNKSNEKKKISEKKYLHNNESENHILKKVKAFFREIF